MFIRRRKNNRSLASILLVAFIFSSIISQSSAILVPYFKDYGVFITKIKSDRTSNIQSPFEKSEKEEKQSEEETQFISLLLEAIHLTASETGRSSLYTDPQSCGDSAHVPLYLFIRTLLI
jgi:hypothetical protein